MNVCWNTAYSLFIYTVSALHLNPQVVNFQRYDWEFTHPITVVPVSGIHCHVRASSPSDCALCTWLDSTV